MCVVALAWRAHPHWPLILAGNRDEFHARAATPLARWPTPPGWSEPGLIGGQDLQSGGMWLGVSEAGRFAVVTNLTGFGAPEPALRSRGALVRDWLEAGLLDADGLMDFNPFNLFVATPEGAHLLSNRPGPAMRALEPGLHTLSNAQPGVPWPRKDRLERDMQAWLDRDDGAMDTLFDLLKAEDWPDGTPEPRPEDDRLPSPVFIRDTVYGTRCSTVIAIDAKGRGQAMERRFDSAGYACGESMVPFAWPMP